MFIIQPPVFFCRVIWNPAVADLADPLLSEQAIQEVDEEEPVQQHEHYEPCPSYLSCTCHLSTDRTPAYLLHALTCV